MQRCPYLFEMKERLLGSQRADTIKMESFDRERDSLLEQSSRPGSNQVGTVATVVKVRVSSFDTPQKFQVITDFFLIIFKRKHFCFLVSLVDQKKKSVHCIWLLNVVNNSFGLFQIPKKRLFEQNCKRASCLNLHTITPYFITLALRIFFWNEN